MRPLVVFLFAVVSLLVFGVTEYLLRSSLSHTGLFSETAGEDRLVFCDFVSQFFSLFTLFILGLFYSELDGAIKKTEPCYQLSKPNGSSGWGSLCVDYFGTSKYFAPFTAINHQHWAVLCSSLAEIVSTNAVPTVALGIFVLDDTESTAMNVTFTRIFEGLLGFICVLGIILAILLWRRKSKIGELSSDFEDLIQLTSQRHPENSLYNFFSGFEKIDYMSDKELDEVAGPRRFQLCQDTKTGRFHIVLLEDCASEITEKHPKGKRQILKAAWHSTWKHTGGRLKTLWEKIPTDRLWKDNHPMLFQTIPISVTIVLLLGLFVVANGQPFWAANSRFFTFLGNKRFARSTVSTIINTVIMQKVEGEAKTMEPSYLLLKRDGAPFSVLGLSYFTSVPFKDLFAAFVNPRRLDRNKRSNYVLFFILLGTYGGGFFQIAWNILNLNSDGYGFWMSICMMIVSEILILIALGVIVVHRRHPIFPRKLLTLASKLVCVYATDIIKDVEPSISESGASLNNIPTPSVGTHSNEVIQQEASSPPHNPAMISDTDEAQTSSASPPNLNLTPPEETEMQVPMRDDQLSDLSHTPTQRPSADGSLASLSIQATASDSQLSNSSMHTAPTHPQSISEPLAPSPIQARSGTASSVEGPLTTLQPYRGQHLNQPMERDEDLQSITCALGMFIGRDGKIHLGIGRHETRLGKYRFGTESLPQDDV